jgi:hypothetical protein
VKPKLVKEFAFTIGGLAMDEDEGLHLVFPKLYVRQVCGVIEEGDTPPPEVQKQKYPSSPAKQGEAPKTCNNHGGN